MMNCKQASRLLSQWQECRGSLQQRMALRLHLAFCAACRRFASQLELLRTAIRQVSHTIENDTQLRMSQQAHQRIAKVMQQHERPGGDDGQHSPGNKD